MKGREYSELTSKKNVVLVNHGKIQQEAEVENKDFEIRNKSIVCDNNNFIVFVISFQRHNLNIKQRDSMIMDQSNTFQLKGKCG